MDTLTIATKVLNNGLNYTQVVNCMEYREHNRVRAGIYEVVFNDGSSIEFDSLHDVASLYNAKDDTYKPYALDKELARWFAC